MATCGQHSSRMNLLLPTGMGIVNLNFELFIQIANCHFRAEIGGFSRQILYQISNKKEIKVDVYYVIFC